MTAHFDVPSVVAKLRDAGLEARENWPVGVSTTYGVGGAASCGVRVDSDDDARRLAHVLAASGPPDVLVVGRGSNLLVSDEGFVGVAVFTSVGRTPEEIRVDGEIVVAPGRMPMPVLARRSAAAGRGGLEWAVGIPGTVGGAVRMNAGGHGSDMATSLVSVRMLSLASGREADVDPADLGLHFRGSALAPHHLVLSASMTSTEVDPTVGADLIADIVAWRRDNQPGGRNAGSVFVNPGSGPESAGALIDSCGLRGACVGAACVSEKHANFVMAGDGARARDIVDLMARVQDSVAERTGIVLRSEVRLVGFDGDVSERFSDPRHSGPEHLEDSRRLARLMGEA